MSTLRVMTLNLGGGLKNFSGTLETNANRSEALLALINQINPDLLCVQEIAQYIDADGLKHSMVDLIREGARFSHAYYGETLSMKRHMQVRKDLMVEGLFKDWWDWSKGNAVFSRAPFARLGSAKQDGFPRNVPIFQPLTYEGTRDTDPRFAIITRIKRAPFPYLVNLHLTTLVGERGEHQRDEVIRSARELRSEQIRRVIDLVEVNILRTGLPLILTGDFNANPDEYALAGILEAEKGFMRLVPENPISTHPFAGAVDHFYISPRGFLREYHCRVVDNDLAHRSSDHLPVVADLTFA
ncbi:MAG TPA: endonuclease/exonuclease/phosphatase family protein [Anaerolineaceae bacterium]|jgi:endonuclease/exonuclease/phosphatase family metal-dependent hydrolase|nr:endonuclease/exonuclease/phosphatase family protein [Anaerolineaceae bacterium]